MSAFLHSGDLGDIIYALPVIRQLGGGTLYLTSRKDTREPMTAARFEFIKPLLVAQPFIEAVEMHKGQKIKHDFTDFRTGYTAGVTLAEIQRRHVAAICPRIDYAKPWLVADPQVSHRPVIARSARYRNPEWDSIWPTVFQIGNPIFVGTKEEHLEFQEQFGEVEHQPVSTAKQLAEIIAGSSLFIGNQSFPFSVAEGLKIARVLECSPNARDCIYPGGDVSHVYKRADWALAEPTRLILALQTHPGDIHAALELASLISAIEDEVRDDVEIAVCVRDDVENIDAENLVDTFRRSFERVHLFRSKRGGRGWPDGCNDLWQETMSEMKRLCFSRQTKADGVLTFEADSVPGRKDWIDALKHEWSETKRKGKMAFGHIHPARGPDSMHMNGNMVLAIDSMKRFPKLQSSNGPWDMSHRRLFLENGIDSKLILNLYNYTDEMTVDEFLALERAGVRPALIHGIKNDSGRIALEASIKRGWL